MGPGMPGSTPPVQLTTEQMAIEAFKHGDDGEGMKLMYASALVSEEGRDQIGDDLKWVTYLRKPTLGIRWGVGVDYDPPAQYKGHPCPIGYHAPAGAPGTGTPSTTSNQQQPKRPRILGQARMMQQQQKNQNNNSGTSTTPDKPALVPPSKAPERLAWFTGDLGDGIVDLLASRMSEGKFGEGLRKAQESGAAPPVTNQPGMMGPTVMMPAAPPPLPGQSNSTPSEKFAPAQVTPGVTYLGEGSQKDLVSAAEKAGVDFIIIFDVSVRPPLNKPIVANNTKYRVMSVERAKLPSVKSESSEANPNVIYASKTLSNQKVASAREDGKDDPLEAELAAFAATIDEQVACGPLPSKLNEELAVKRATFLAEHESANPLPSLAEIRCYQVKGLLTPKQTAELASTILGADKAKRLFTGKDEAERRQALAKYLGKLK